MIQERYRLNHDVTYLDHHGELISSKRMRARIMPCYRFMEGEVDVVGESALFSEFWKVHGGTHGGKRSVHCGIDVTY